MDSPHPHYPCFLLLCDRACLCPWLYPYRVSDCEFLKSSEKKKKKRGNKSQIYQALSVDTYPMEAKEGAASRLSTRYPGKPGLWPARKASQVPSRGRWDRLSGRTRYLPKHFMMESHHWIKMRRHPAITRLYRTDAFMVRVLQPRNRQVASIAILQGHRVIVK